MRDDKSFSVVSTAGTPPADALLSWVEWQSLPVSTRVCDRLVEILILASEIQADLESDAGRKLRWIAPEVDRVFEEIDALLQRLAA